MNVHTPQTGDQIHRTSIFVSNRGSVSALSAAHIKTVPNAVSFLEANESALARKPSWGYEGYLREHVVDLIVGVRHLNGDLSEIIRVRSRQNLLVVVQILRHGDQMVLDVGQI